MLEKTLTAIERIRTWPEEDRRRFAYVVSGGIFLVCVCVWLILLPFILRVPQTAEDQKLSGGSSKLPSLGQIFKSEVLEARRSAVDSLKDIAKTSPKAGGDELIPVNEAGVGPIEFPASQSAIPSAQQ